MASIWRKPDSGIWCVAYRESGARVVRSLRTRDAREARKLKREIERFLDEAGTVALFVAEQEPERATVVSIEDFWTGFLEWARENRSPKSVDEYTNWFTQLRDFANVETVGEIDSALIEKFKLSLSRQGKRKPTGVGLQKRSINSAIQTLKSIWNHAKRLKLYEGENPFTDVQSYRVPVTHDKNFLGKPEIEALLSAAADYGDQRYVKRVEARNVQIAIALMALAGLRKREVCYALWEWIDCDGKVILVDSHKEFTTKNRKPRVISMSSQLLEILDPYRQEKGYILEKTRTGESSTEYRTDFKKGFAAVCRLAGVKATPHALRHSFASRHAVAGTSLHVIAGWLGHSTTWMTQRYAHFQKSYNDAAENI